ncbi:MAG: hypothetical protein U9O87_08260 [Verrucomicrobiota bacterium]|nr:hypothetical protein [Verrucomicrobiota bacterium]
MKFKTRDDITKFLSDYEISLEDRINNFNFSGVNFWPIIKISNAYSLYQQSLNNNNDLEREKQNPIKLRLDHYVPWLKLKLIDFKKNQNINLTNDIDICIITRSIDRRLYLSDAGWFCIFSDSLRKTYPDLNIINLERVVKKSPKYPRYNPSVVINGLETINGHLIKKDKFNLSKDFINSYKIFLQSNNLNYDKSKLINQIQYFFSIFNTYTSIFRKLSPKLVFVVNWYSTAGMAICYAAKRLKIPCFDFQHGMQSKEHFGYSGWENLPINAYSIFPSHFWVWSSKERDNLIKNNSIFKDSNIVEGGNLWLNLWLKNSLFLEEPLTYAEKVFCQNKKYILVTLQTNSNFEIKFIYDIIKNSPDNWSWLIRVHPSETKGIGQLKNIFKCFGEKIEIDHSTKLPLYAIFKRIDSHITGFSTCAIEALNFGIKSVIFHPNGKKAFENYIEEKSFYYAEDVQNALSILKYLIKLNLQFKSKTPEIYPIKRNFF